MNTIIFKDFPKICRLCLESGTLQPILNTKHVVLLNSLTNIKVNEQDKLPENICNDCVKQLEDISSFIATCENNDQTLKKIVEKYEQGLAEHTDSCDNDNDGEPCEDDPPHLKNEDNDSSNSYSEYNVKQEFILVPEFDEADNIEEGPVSCENCSENFSDSQSLNDHYKEIVMCRPRDYYEASSVPNIIEYLKKGRKEKRLRIKKEKHKEESAELCKGKILKGKRRFLCCYCGKKYTRKNGLDRHILSHTGVKPFECKECGKRYITKDTLKTHLLTHTGVKSHECRICHKMFTQSSHLSYHLKRHAGEKPYSCTSCGKGFLSNYHLERHKLMHTGVKPFECHLCGKQFVRGTTLRDHILIHTGEKPFQCQHCGKQFNRKQSLTNHVLVHTGQVKNSNVPICVDNSGVANSSGNINSVALSRSENGEPLNWNSANGVIGHHVGCSGLSNGESVSVMPVGHNLMYSGSNSVNNGY